MSFQGHGDPTLDYQPVSYPGSLLHFRGPATDISAPHVLCLGGTETFGRFVPAPYPTRLRALVDLPVSNLGATGGGLDVMLADGAIRAALKTAHAVVLQVPGAHTLSNRFFTVHPRRNDRFIEAAPALRALYRDVDFTEFHFTRHLLSHLKSVSADRFDCIRDELQTAWSARIQTLLGMTSAPVHLLWLSRRNPAVEEPVEGLGEEPHLVKEPMLSAITNMAASCTIVQVLDESGARTTRGMYHAASEADAARMLPGPSAHEAAAMALLPHL